MHLYKNNSPEFLTVSVVDESKTSARTFVFAPFSSQEFNHPALDHLVPSLLTKVCPISGILLFPNAMVDTPVTVEIPTVVVDNLLVTEEHLVAESDAVEPVVESALEHDVIEHEVVEEVIQSLPKAKKPIRKR